MCSWLKHRRRPREDWLCWFSASTGTFRINHKEFMNTTQPKVAACSIGLFNRKLQIYNQKLIQSIRLHNCPQMQVLRKDMRAPPIPRLLLLFHKESMSKWKPYSVKQLTEQKLASHCLLAARCGLWLEFKMHVAGLKANREREREREG